MKTILLSIFSFLTIALIGQSKWTQVPSGTTNQLNSIFFVDSQVGFIAGNDSLLLKTNDGGKTWARIAVNLAFQTQIKDVLDVWFADINNGFLLIGPYGDIYETNNGGASWSPSMSSANNMCFRRSFYFRSMDDGFLGGSMCFQGETIARRDSGSWDTPQVVGSWNADDQITNFDFLNTQLGLASSTSSYMFRTTDNGISWDSIPTPLDSLTILDVSFWEDTIAYACYAETGLEGILVSQDSGKTWQRDLGSATFYYPGFHDILSTENGTLFIGGYPSHGSYGVIFEKSISFPWWNYHNVDHPIRKIHFHSDSIFFAIGDSGYVVRRSVPSTISIAEDTKDQIKVFPNPAKYEFKMEGIPPETSVFVYNSAGVLIEERKPNFSALWDCTSWRSGLYFVLFSNPRGTSFVKVLIE